MGDWFDVAAWGWPQLVLLGLLLLGLGIAWGNHGELREGRHSAWISLTATLINLFLLAAGGFFA